MEDMKKKTLLDKLGERYYTIEHNGGYLLYDKEGKAKRANMLFKGLFYLASSGKSYVFQEEYYETPEELIHAMEEWAKTLPFDVELYNPSFKKSYMIECAVHDYLESLGFVRDGRTCTLSDASGKELCTIECKVEDGKPCGTITRSVSENSWQEAKFTDLDSAIGACNILLSTYCLMVNSLVTGMMSKMTNHRASIFLTKTFDMMTLSVHAEDAKQKAIEQLEAELKRLKEG